MLPSPKIKHLQWGRIDPEGCVSAKDYKLYPGGGRPWDWSETGTRHKPGIQPRDVQELIDRGCDVVVLTRGMELLLHTMPETIALLEAHGIEVHVAETSAAMEIYNSLTETRAAGGLFHSTC